MKSRAAFLASASDMAQARYGATVELERYREDQAAASFVRRAAEQTLARSEYVGERITTGQVTVEFGESSTIVGLEADGTPIWGSPE